MSIIQDILNAGSSLEDQESLVKRCVHEGMNPDENTSLQIYRKLNSLEMQFEAARNDIWTIMDAISAIDEKMDNREQVSG